MSVRLAALCLFAAALCLLAAAAVVPSPLVAQTTSAQRSANAVALDPDDPRARRAAALATLLVGANPGHAVHYLRRHAAPDSPAARQIDKQVEELRETIGPGYVIDRVLEVSEDEVLVLMTTASDARVGRMGLRVAVERKEPYRIREVQTVRSRRQSGAGL